MTARQLISVRNLKRLAKKIQKERCLAQLSDGQELAAREIGYENWHHAIRTLGRAGLDARTNVVFSTRVAITEALSSESVRTPFFVTEDGGAFSVEHFLTHIGAPANIGLFGGTGSGKHKVSEALLGELAGRLNANIMILDAGGGNSSPWSDFCSSVGGVEINVLSEQHPCINPFELSLTEAYPNGKKSREIADQLGLNLDLPEARRILNRIYYIFTGPRSLSHVKSLYGELCSLLPTLSKFTPKELHALLRLAPGTARPGNSSFASILLVVQLMLSYDFINGTPSASRSLLSIEALKEAISSLYETYVPPANQPERWPTITDFCKLLTSLNEDGERGRVFNYWHLVRCLSEYCLGGSKAFLDGQTEADAHLRNTKTGKPSSVVLVNMSGISDNRERAIYTVLFDSWMGRNLSESGSVGFKVRDEADFLKSSWANQYMEADYRLARESGFGVITIAQRYSCFQSTVIQNNTQKWVICNLPTLDERELANERFCFTAAEKEMFESHQFGTKIERDTLTGQARDVYSRVMVVKSHSERFVVTLPLGKDSLKTDDSQR